MKVRAKFKVSHITEHVSGDKQIFMHPVYSSDPNHENKAFNDATPGGSITLHIAAGKKAADTFKNGHEYYVDFTPANHE